MNGNSYKDLVELLNNLFSKFSIRLKNENNLSDITWAFIKIIPEFKYDMLNYFDFNVSKADEIEVYREYGKNKFRADFAFIWTDQNKKFILENKIYDRNYHIKIYSKIFQEINKNVKFGLLINHDFDSKNIDSNEVNKWKIKKWEGFIKYIEEKNKQKKYNGKVQLIDAYIKYVKEVCSMKPIKKIKLDLSELSSLYYLNNLIETIINNASNDQYEYKKERDACGPSWSGFLYYLEQKDNKDNKVRIWFGIDFTEPGTINIGIHKRWDICFFKKLVNNYKGLQSEWFDIDKKYFETDIFRSICKMKNKRHL